MTRSGTPINKGIGKRVHSARRDRGITQKALADEAGTSFAVISRLETGSQSVSAERLAAIARVLRVSLDDLCREEDMASEREDAGVGLGPHYGHAGGVPRLSR